MSESWTWDRVMALGELLRALPYDPTHPELQELGEALGFMAEQLVQHEQAIARLEAEKADRTQVESLQEQIEGVIEHQRDTIEALLAENELLRAQLYLHDRKDVADEDAT